ncbi:hypothetical protein C0J52_02529 [Blattella germanica]|nr:hypothetical protein C0J52_02529 [Blattella germanica]
MVVIQCIADVISVLFLSWVGRDWLETNTREITSTRGVPLLSLQGSVIHSLTAHVRILSTNTDACLIPATLPYIKSHGVPPIIYFFLSVIIAHQLNE